MADMDPDAIEDFLATPRDAVLSVVLASGRLMGTPIWFRWVDGSIRFQSPTSSSKTAAIRSSGRASLCVHDQTLPLARYVTLEGPVVEVHFDFESDIGSAARHYLGDGAAHFLAGIEQALASGREWASFELRPTSIIARTQSLG
jgi:hypothetical protein